MFCLAEESLANHMGERKLRENIEELEEKQIKLQRAVSETSDASEIAEAKPIGDANANIEEVDPNDIVVVQVGEKERTWNPDGPV